MTYFLQQLDKRGSLNLPTSWRKKHDIAPKGASLLGFDCDGFLILIPLVGDAHRVYLAHGEKGVMEWVKQRSELTIHTVTPLAPPSPDERQYALKEKQLRLKHDLKMQQLSGQAEILRLKQMTARIRAEALLDARAGRNAKRYEVVPPPMPTAEEVTKFQEEQALAFGFEEPKVVEDSDLDLPQA